MATGRLLTDFSLEMTCKDVPALRRASATIPPGTRVHVTHLEHDDLTGRVAAVGAVRALGLVPVPHVAARRLRSAHELEALLDALRSAGPLEDLFVVGGDPASPRGPYEDALALITSGLLEAYGVRRVGLAGYPEGHPRVDTDTLWNALDHKVSELRHRSIAAEVVSQLGFDVEAVLDWIAAVRERGLDLPIRVGVPGPVGVRRLLRYASRLGVATSSGLARKYGFSLTHLMGTAGPDRFLDDLSAGLDAHVHGEVGVHLYTFGGLEQTAAYATGSCGYGRREWP